MEMELFYQLFLALFLGALIGLEREAKRKEAGLQTYSLVAMGTCLFTMIAFEMVDFFSNEMGITLDPTRIIQAIAIGIGFVGAGAIFRHGAGVVGLTTAAGLWVTAAIGIAVGAKLYVLSIVTTILALFVLIVLGLFESKIFEKKSKKENNN